MSKELHTYIEPELEARITALVLGEASEFEVDELERMIEEKPELALFRQRIGLMHDLLGEAVKATPDKEWQLSAERRAVLRSTFSSKGRPAAEPRPRDRGWKNWQAAITIAACLLVCVVLFSMMTPTYKRALDENASWTITSYSAGGETDEEYFEESGRGTSVYGSKAASDGTRMAQLKTELPREVIEGTPRPIVLPAKTPDSQQPAEKSLALKRRATLELNGIPPTAEPSERSRGLSKRQPAIPGSSSAKAIASNTISPAVVPTPKANAPVPPADMANYDAFGDGKNGGGGGGAQGSDPFASASLGKKRELAKDGTHERVVLDELAMREKEGSALNKRLESLARYKTPDKPEAGSSSRRAGYAYDQKGGHDRGGNEEAAEQNEFAVAGTDSRRGDLATPRKLDDVTLDKLARARQDGELFYQRQAAAGPEGVDKETNERWNKDENRDTLRAKSKRSGFASRATGISLDFDDDVEAGSGVDVSRHLTEHKPPELPGMSKSGIKRDLLNIRSGDNVKFSLDRPDVSEELARASETPATQPEQKASEVDRASTRLSMAEAYYNLGKYDEAEAEMKKVLQGDPHNKIARNMLEKVATTTSDYNRAAYDSTRAELLKEVDESWEWAGPGAKRKSKQPAQAVPLPAPPSRPAAAPVIEKKAAAAVPSPLTPKALPDETITAAEPFSTFSLNVADVSFKLAKQALLEKGRWPDAAKVRTEEFVNAFNYGDAAPRRGEPVACAVEQSAHPFLQQRNLLRVGMKTASVGRSTPLRLTVLLDNSGSMEREDREASVLAAMQVLAAQLGPQDVISLVGFARQPRLLADRITGDKAGQLVRIVANTPSEGGTNLEEALRLARTLAQRQHKEGAQDRVVLITDGVANLGNTVPEELAREIETMRQQGIAFDACGVGAEGLNDEILEALTRKGDGRYYFLNRAEDADSGFAKQLAGALSPAAKNVKVQVKFNPRRVTRYRLLGFEKHRLNKEDFRNDKVDAAEMAAEEAGNAVYQIQVNPEGEGEVGEVFVRFLDMSTGRMVERSWPLPYEPKAKAFDQAAPSMQLAGTAAMLGEKLHGTDAGSVRFSMIAKTLGQLRGHYAADPKVQDLVRMCEKVK